MSCPSDHYHRDFVTVTVLRMDARSLGHGRLKIEVDPTATSLAKTISDCYGPPQLASLFGGQARIGRRMRFVGVVIQRNLRSAWVLLWKCHWGC